jgi:magnesium-protoporphyrin O-methyltransferase
MSYADTRARVETYFDRTATKVWDRLTSDVPVSGIRATVRAGRDRMRALMLDQLPADLRGARVLDAGCGTGTMAVELARRGASVVAVDISPQLIGIARERAPQGLAIDWRAGDMMDPALGAFDAILAMDSMIYYSADDVAGLLARAAPRLSGRFIFTLAPRTVPLMIMWRAGKLFPASDRSPQMVPHRARDIRAAARAQGLKGDLAEAGTIKSGFYISQALVYEGGRA